MSILLVMLLLAVAGGVTFAVVAAVAGKKKKEPKAIASESPRNLVTLQVNDIVTHFAQDFLVEGKLTYEEDGDQWYDYMLVDGNDLVWLSVEDDKRIEVGVFREVSDLKFTSKPPEHIDYQGRVYTLEEWGRAVVTRVGETGTKTGMKVTYYEYEEPGGSMLSVEQWGEGSFEVSLGEPARPEEFEILPGDGV